LCLNYVLVLRRRRIMYGEEFPEWRMEKHRFYCELPGDIWDDGYFMSLVRRSMQSSAVRKQPA